MNEAYFLSNVLLRLLNGFAYTKSLSLGDKFACLYTNRNHFQIKRKQLVLLD